MVARPAPVIGSPIEAGRLRMGLLLLCSIAYFLDGLIHSIMGPLAPGVAASLDLSRAELGPVFSANLAGQCLGLLLIPYAAPRYGHRAIIVAALIGIGFSQFATAFVTGRDMLIALRALTGFFLGGALPSCLAIVAAATPMARRGLAMGILFTGYGLGNAAAGLVGTFWTGADWTQAMIWTGGACFLSALAVRYGMRLDLAGEREEVEEKVAPLVVLSRRYLLGTLMLWTFFICLLTISYSLNSWLPTMLTDVGRDPAYAALSVTIFNIGGTAATLTIGPMIDCFGSRRILSAALVVAAASLLCVGQVVEGGSEAMLTLVLAIAGFSSLGAYCGINVVLAEFYPGTIKAIGIGWTKSVGRLGTVIAPVLIGIGLSGGIGEGTMLSLFALPAVAALGALLVITGRMRDSHSPARESIGRVKGNKGR